MRRIRILPWSLLSALILAFALATPSMASVSYFPFKTRMELPPGVKSFEPARAGEAISGVLVVECRAEIDVYDFALSGEGWTLERFDAPENQIVDAGTELRMPFTATPTDPDAPLRLAFSAGSRAVSQDIAMGPAAERKWNRPPEAVQQRQSDGSLGPVRVTAGAEDGQAKARTLDVTGRIRYTRGDGQEVGALRVKVELWDDNGILPHGLLDWTYTGDDGSFWISEVWPEDFFDPDPDLYLKYYTDSDRILTRPEGVWPFVGPYTWTTPVTQNFTGTDLDYGDLLPNSESDNVALHIHTNGNRAWSFLLSKASLSAPKVTYLYPSPNWPAYNQVFQEIYVPEDFGDDDIPFQWKEDTQIHEYGHHVINNFAQPTIPDYCNSVCDEQAEGWIWELDCGHCVWCEENPSDAWAEGWPNWFADAVTRSFPSTYGLAADYTRSQEIIRDCVDSNGDACACDPWETEGFLGALLRDIEDYGFEDDDGDGFGDRLSLGSDEIFDITTDFSPTTPAAFITFFRTQYPQHDEDLWETAFNVGYQLDTSNPGAVSNFTSTSHTANGTSTDPTVALTWNHATDDISGIAGYSIHVSTGGPQIPNTTPEVGKVTTWTSSTLATGSTYWFNIRALDRAGRASSTYRSFGPVTIVAPDPANFAFYERTGWDEVVVPRAENNSTSSSVPAPTDLLDPAATRINLSAQNDGQTSAPGQTTRIYVDDVYRYWLSWGTIGAGVKFYATNYGPISIRGGRHTFEARLDAIEGVDETDETDNDFGLQWIWDPTALAPGTPVLRSTPSDATAGWAAIPTGVTRWYNVDGYRFDVAGGFRAVTMAANPADYDLRMHLPATGATSGFASNVGFGTRPAGCLEVVVANSYQASSSQFDVGVMNRYDGSGNYLIETHAAPIILQGDSTTVAVASGEYFLMRQLKFPAPGPMSVSLQVDPNEGPWHLAWFDDSFAQGDVLDTADFTTTDAEGFARLNVTVDSGGYHAFVMFRDPKDSSAATAVTYEVQTTPPDVLAYEASGWHGPLVPRANDDGSSSSVPVPSSLVGDAASTYLNVATRNESPTGMGSLRAHVHLDGVYTWWLSWGSFGANATSLFNWSSAWTVRGGRHTLSVHHDANSTYEELSEANNVFGEQFIWEPTNLVLDTPRSRGTPPSRTGGWDDITVSETRWYNADGLRTPDFAVNGSDGYWGMVAVMPAASANVDVRLHERSTGAKNGFASNLAYSGFGTGLVDYVLINFRSTSHRGFDAGFLNASGSGGYTAEADASVYLGAGAGSHGPYTLEKDEIADVYDFKLDPGIYILSLENRGADADLALGIHSDETSFLERADSAPLATLADEGVGGNVYATLEVTKAGYYAVVVSKESAASLSQEVDYVLHVHGGVTGVEPPAPGVARTQIAGINPNPFNPSTEIAFSLQSASRVQLEIYNLRGEKVRTLVDESRSVGTHQVRWDGRDDDGRGVSSGVYMARLSALGVEDRRKMVLVK